MIALSLEHLDGKHVGSYEWESDVDIVSAMAEVGAMVKRESNVTLREDDIAACFGDLAELLRVATSRAECRPIVQVSPPQWAVTTQGIATYNHNYPRLGIEALRRDDMAKHMAEKSWTDMESFEEAQMAALALFGDG